MAIAAISGVATPDQRDRDRDDVVGGRDGEVLAHPPHGGPGDADAPRPRGARLAPTSTMSAAARAASRPEAGATETWAAASAAVSLSPSPTISTRRPSAASARTRSALAAGVRPACQRSMPSARAVASTTGATSPERSSHGEAPGARARRAAPRRAGPGRVLEGEARGRLVADPQHRLGARGRARRRPTRRGRAARGGRPPAPSMPWPGTSRICVDVGRRRRPAPSSARASACASGCAEPARERRAPPRGRPRAGRRGPPARACPASACRSCRAPPCRPRASRSSAVPEVTRRPLRNSRPEAAVTTAGTARPSAQGQVMMSTAAETLIAVRTSPPVFHIQAAKAASETAWTRGE